MREQLANSDQVIIFLKSYNIVVAWKTKGAEEYWLMLVDNQSTPLQAPQKLPANVRFSAHDGFVTMANGDVVWTASVNGNLTLFRLPKGRAPVQWTQVSGLATDIGAAADGAAWIIGTGRVPEGYSIHRMAPGATA